MCFDLVSIRLTGVAFCHVLCELSCLPEFIHKSKVTLWRTKKSLHIYTVLSKSLGPPLCFSYNIAVSTSLINLDSDLEHLQSWRVFISLKNVTRLLEKRWEKWSKLAKYHWFSMFWTYITSVKLKLLHG